MSLYHASTCCAAARPCPVEKAYHVQPNLSLSISQSLVASISTLRWNAVRTCPLRSNELVVTRALTSCTAATRRHPSGEGLPGSVSVAMITMTVFLVSMMVRRASRHGKYMAFSVMLQRAVMPKCCSSHSRRATWPPSTWRSKARSHDADYS